MTSLKFETVLTRGKCWVESVGIETNEDRARRTTAKTIWIGDERYSEPNDLQKVCADATKAAQERATLVEQKHGLAPGTLHIEKASVEYDSMGGGDGPTIDIFKCMLKVSSSNPLVELKLMTSQRYSKVLAADAEKTCKPRTDQALENPSTWIASYHWEPGIFKKGSCTTTWLDVILKDPPAQVTQVVGPEYSSVRKESVDLCRARTETARARGKVIEEKLGLAPGSLSVTDGSFDTIWYSSGETGFMEYYQCKLGYASQVPTLSIEWHATDARKSLKKAEVDTACLADYQEKLADPMNWMVEYRMDDGTLGIRKQCWVTWVSVSPKSSF